MLETLEESLKIVEDAYQDFEGEIIASTSFGRNSGLLLGLITESELPIPIVHIDPGDVAEENKLYAEKLEAALGQKAVRFFPNNPPTAEDWGQYHRDDAGKQRFYEKFKLVTLSAALNTLRARAALFGVRADQSEHRRSLQVREEHDGVCKIYPLLRVSEEEALAYLRERGLPIHPHGPPGKKLGVECGLHVA